MSFTRLPLRAAAMIVLTSTLLLFYTGFHLQQRSIASLRATLAASYPPTPPTRAQLHAHQISLQHAAQGLNTQLFTAESRAMGLGTAEILQQTALTAAHKKTHAYATYVLAGATASDVCNAVQLLAKLHTLPDVSKGVTRLLIHPAIWAPTDTMRRLLQTAEKRYGAKLIAAEGLELGAQRILAVALGFHGDVGVGYKRILLLSPRGAVMRGMDDLLFDTPLAGAPVALVPDRSGAVVLTAPGAAAAAAIEASTAATARQDMAEAVKATFGLHFLALPAHPWMTPVDVFHAGTGETRAAYTWTVWNETRVWEEMRYLRFVDDEGVGPWTVAGARRAGTGHWGRRVKGVYREWERRRGEVCGLDLI